ncbi:Rz1-like lysis system protein LysC [Lysobacter enzymogenes]|uniref:Rz1-like lysis system protein LysC n=1 Tax=Lysobacter enzymogenes TaxID=69 RepID=UPI00089D3181|nr:hypothetical protein [Lysobacter enzymogenes]SDW94526.1 hypothetical protein SAMN05421681_103299 [Lysobacter enzymogenes]
MRIAALIALVVLAGCQTTAPAPTVPSVVRVPVQTFVPLPAELTRDCEDVPKQSNTYGEAVRLANARKAAADECTSRMRQIRNLQPEAKP